MFINLFLLLTNLLFIFNDPSYDQQIQRYLLQNYSNTNFPSNNSINIKF